MTKRKVIVIACIALLGTYLAAYACIRITHRIVRFQNRSGGKQEVVARPEEWSDLLIDMAEGKPIIEAYARGQKRAPGFLNFVFWPLRSIEEAWWNQGKGCGQPGAPGYRR
jgi:hypothetical protein